jgi:hypothetical protein
MPNAFWQPQHLILVIGDLEHLEVMMEMLSSEAVKVAPGMPALLPSSTFSCRPKDQRNEFAECCEAFAEPAPGLRAS